MRGVPQSVERNPLDRADSHLFAQPMPKNRFLDAQKGKEMTDDEAINVLVQHFLLDNERSLQEVTSAMFQFSETMPYDALGRATFAAMTKTHMAQLQAAKATLTAKQPKRKPE